MEKRKNLLINILYFSVLMVILYVVLKYVFVWFLPFLIGFLFASAANLISKKMFQNTKCNRSWCSLAIIAILYLVILLFVILFSNEFIIELQERISNLPRVYNESVVPLIDSVVEFGEGFLPNLKTFGLLETFKVGTENMLVSFSGKAVSFFTNFLSKIPSFLMAMFFAVVSSVLIVWDYDKIIHFIDKQLSKKARDVLIKIREIIYNSVFRLLKAYLILMVITFVELSVGFLILGVHDPFAKAISIALADFLPLIGVSVVFIPWIIVLLFQKKFYLAIGLAVLYLIITAIRNFIEPKIVGKEIGISSILSLICFYVGLKLFGFWGVILLPIVVILIKTLNDEGIVKFWKS